MKKFLGLTLLGAGIFAVVKTARSRMAHRRMAEGQRYQRDLERFEGEGGTPAGV